MSAWTVFGFVRILTVHFISGANVTHSYTLKPLKTGYIETTSAVVSYKTTPNGDAKVSYRWNTLRLIEVIAEWCRLIG